MGLPTVKGTKIRGGRYYMNLRVPASLGGEYVKDVLRQSLGTRDPDVAR